MADVDGVCPSCGGSGYVGDFGADPGAGSGADVELGPFGKKFLGCGLILLGLWTAPGFDADAARWLIPGTALGLGVMGLIQGIADTEGTGWSPFSQVTGLRGSVLRVLWFFRPRLWLVAWAGIVAGFMFYGSPHLRIQYGPGGCDYWGLNGWERYGRAGTCPIVKAFPLRF
jgi:hypothetical protein